MYILSFIIGVTLDHFLFSKINDAVILLLCVTMIIVIYKEYFIDILKSVDDIPIPVIDKVDIADDYCEIDFVLPAEKPYIFNFGKYKGKCISEVSNEYIHWLLSKRLDEKYNIPKSELLKKIR